MPGEHSSTALERSLRWRPMRIRKPSGAILPHLSSRSGRIRCLLFRDQPASRAWRRLHSGRRENRDELRIEQRPRDVRGNWYIATIEGVDVFEADFTPGASWLFSARTLQSTHYAELDRRGPTSTLHSSLSEEMEGRCACASANASMGQKSRRSNFALHIRTSPLAERSGTDPRTYCQPATGEEAHLTVDRVTGPGGQRWWSKSLVRARGR